MASVGTFPEYRGNKDSRRKAGNFYKLTFASCESPLLVGVSSSFVSADHAIIPGNSHFGGSITSNSGVHDALPLIYSTVFIDALLRVAVVFPYPAGTVAVVLVAWGL